MRPWYHFRQYFGKSLFVHEKHTFSEKGRHFCEFCENDVTLTMGRICRFPKNLYNPPLTPHPLPIPHPPPPYPNIPTPSYTPIGPGSGPHGPGPGPYWGIGGGGDIGVWGWGVGYREGVGG